MQVHVGEMNTTVRATDSSSLLSPAVLEQITNAVLERLRQRQARERSLEEDRLLRPGVSAEETRTWR